MVYRAKAIIALALVEQSRACQLVGSEERGGYYNSIKNYNPASVVLSLSLTVKGTF